MGGGGADGPFWGVFLDPAEPTGFQRINPPKEHMETWNEICATAWVATCCLVSVYVVLACTVGRKENTYMQM